MTTTRDRILDSAEHLAATRGYTGFSYADISDALTITKPSIHHHFPTKAALADALIARYRTRFAQAREPFEDAAMPVRDRLLGYADLYAEVFRTGGRMCLCGMFAAETASLPPSAQAATAAFFHEQERWLQKTLGAAGMPPTQADKAARTYLSALEGALLLTRTAHQHEPSNLTDVATTLVDALLTTPT